MARVVALYRYPVKGLSPERQSSLDILPSGRVAGDRVLAFRFGNVEEPDAAWSPKASMLCLMNTPGLAGIAVRFDAHQGRVSVARAGRTLAEEALDDLGRRRLTELLAEVALGLPDNPLADHPERLPLRLVGDGATPRYHDSEAGEVTLHSRESIQALAGALHCEVDEVRFRSNIAVEGVDPWAELAWVGRRVRIGQVIFDVTRSKGRCLATHANPATGVRDLPILTTLTHAFDRAQPTFAVAMRPLGQGGRIAVGDEVEILDV
ncbi:MAG: MOSC domain-containing protein [Chloroflexi bacterium]|nr:MOSC domain-containing protein [Chloroflexota bacterium]